MNWIKLTIAGLIVVHYRCWTVFLRGDGLVGVGVGRRSPRQGFGFAGRSRFLATSSDHMIPDFWPSSALRIHRISSRVALPSPVSSRKAPHRKGERIPTVHIAVHQALPPGSKLPTYTISYQKEHPISNGTSGRRCKANVVKWAATLYLCIFSLERDYLTIRASTSMFAFSFKHLATLPVGRMETPRIWQATT